MQNKFPFMKTLMLCFAAAVFCAQAKAQLPIKKVNANITSNTTWTADHIYSLKTKIYVTNNATLTIEPGTVIIGDTVNKGALIITRGAKINAVGTPCNPIVFTSSKNPGKRARGDWGGLIILGKATINAPGDTAHIEGIPPIPETLYGGGNNPDDADNSGILQYVRVEFAGVALSPNNEINGITFGGVGSGTTVNFVQVSYSNDDSYEWFGGTVNTKHLIAFRGLDDDFDTDNGYSGKNQFLVSLRDPAVADISGSNGFESDNDATGSDNTPRTRAVFSNVTIDAGADSATNVNYRRGAHIRRNSHEYIYNSILLGYPVGVLIDGSNTEANVLADTLFQNNIVAATRTDNWITTTPESSSVEDLLRNDAGNKFYTGNKGVKLTGPYKLKNPDFRPQSTSPALKQASFNHVGLNDPFFTSVKYKGAFDANNDWTDTWANWDPVSTDYSNGASSGCGKQAVAQNNVTAQQVSVADVKLSPNPSQGNFNVALNGFNSNVVNLKVADLNTGKIYFIGKANNNSTTNISVRIPNGNYAVEFSDGKNVVTRKVTILN